MVLFLDPKGAAGNIHVVAGYLVHGIVFATLLEGRPDAEDFAERGELLDRGDAARRRHPAANEVDQAIGNQRHHLKRMGKYFAHCLRSSADLADIPIVSNLSGGRISSTKNIW